ncbi:YadA-like family protein [Luteibacter anthropi]|uniref:Uncharacterized protein n=1 Tax=Luteibacter anthropi TaxID=564369 RepID=A0A7X5ZIT1_9GAMM|nr:hypothetical protein [Luteibacter anthropi]
MKRSVALFMGRVAQATRLLFVAFSRLAMVRLALVAAVVFLAGTAGAQQAAPQAGTVSNGTVTPSASKEKAPVARKAKNKKAQDDEDDTATTSSTKDETPVTSSVAGSGPLNTFGAGRQALTSSPATTNFVSAQGISPSIIAPGDPRYPLPAEPFRAGLILGSGGLIAPSNTSLAPTITTLLNPSSQFINSGALNLNTVNITGTFQSLGIGAANLVNLTPTSTAINGTLLGQNQHLTLLGGVTSDSYITNINRGTDNFTNGGLGGILLPGGSPAWSADCASLLGIPLARCWAVNPAQDNQVIVGDRATANGSQEVVIGRGASHTLPAEDANNVFPGNGRNDPTNPSGVPTNNFATRKGNSVVIGDSAAGTANAQTILGANATSTQVNSVVLGNASLGDRAAQAGYTAFGLTPVQNSVGAVSVGSTGNERQVSHVAAGSDNYDAVNVLQLKGALAGIGALDLLAVTYDPDGSGNPTNSITLKGTGTGSVGLHNLAPGVLGAASLDGVNGAQLNTTNQAVATYFGGTTTANAAGVFTAPTFNTPLISTSGGVTPGVANDVTTAFNNVGGSLTSLNTQIANIAAGSLPYLKINSTGAPSTATGTDAIALGSGANAANNNSIALGAGSTTTVGAQTGYTAIGLATPQSSLGEVAIGTRKLTGLAAGSAPTDAVNVAQLSGVNNAVSSLGKLAVLYDADGSGNATNHISLVGAGAGTVGLGNLSAGSLAAGSTDAVNGGQLNTTNQAVATYFGGTTAANNAGVFTAPTFNTPAISTTGIVTPGTANNVTTAFNTVGGSLTALNTQIANITAGSLPYLKINSTGAPSTATGTDAIALGSGANAANNNSIALGAGSTTTVGAQTGYTAIGIATPQSSLGEVAIGTRKLTGLAAGSAPTDAVNVAQLTGVNNAVSSLGRLAVLYDADGLGNATNHISLVGTGAGTVGLGNLGPGAINATSTDAVNGTQLNTTNQAVATFFGGTTAANGAGVFTAPTFDVPVISNGGVVTPTTASDVTTAFSRVGGSLTSLNTQITNINAGNLPYLKINSTGAPSTAAGVDGIALGSGASAGNANSVALGAGSVTTVGAQTGYTAIGIATPQSSLGEVAVGTRKITGLAAGSAATDAVNVAQLTGVNNSVSALGKLAVRYDADGLGNATNHVSLSGTGTGSVGLGNLGAGTVTATSLDAVNGTQLFGTNTTLAGYLGAGAGFNGTTGTFTPPAFSIGAIDLAGNVTRNTYGTVGQALSQLDSSLGNVNIRLNALDTGGAQYVAVNSSAVLPTATGAEGIAIGGAATAGAAGGVAIGNGASAANANSVALGAGSVTTVGAQTGYTAFGLTAPQTSLGEVNVGTRKITGVAAGSAASDAVNVAQLSAVSGDVGSLGRLAVRYDDDGAGNPTNNITLTGAGTGTVGIHNVGPGVLSTTSHDAVNGTQLNATNQAVVTYLGGGTTVDAGGNFTGPTYNVPVIGTDGTNTPGNAGSVGGALTTIGDSLGNVNTRISSLYTGGLKYVQVNSTAAAASATGAESIAIGGGATAANANSIALGNGSATTVGAQVGYTAYGITAPQTSNGELNLGNRKITGVAAGTLDSDAANIQQLRAVSTDVGSLGRLAVRYDDDGAGNPTNNITLTGAGTGTVGIHNVGPGVLSTTSHDAVNGTQLNATNQAVVTYLGGGTTVDAGGNFTGPTYNVPVIGTDGTNTPGNAGSVGGALTTIGDSLGNVNTRISSLYTGGLKYVQVNSTAAAATATGAESIAIGGGATAANANSIALGGNSATTVGARTNYAAYALTTPQSSTGEVNVGGRQLTGLAAGLSDSDAVNVSQLRAVNDGVAQATAGAVNYDRDSGGNKLNHVTLAGGVAGTVGIGNLADGAVAAGSHDAISGGQLFTSNAALVGFLGAGAAFDPLTSTFTAPTFALRPVDANGNVSNASFGNAGAAFNSIDGSVNALNARVNSLASGINTPYVAVTSTQAPAQASGTESVAIGGGTVASGANTAAYGSQAQATAAGATALGVGSQATVAGGVALGSGSVASRTGSGTEAFSGVAVPAQGVVSVGTAGAERQIANVAGGTDDTDAVNVRQLRAVANLAGSIGASSVQYDDATHGSVTLNPGGAAVHIGNVAAGSIAQASADAITGGQLWQWTQNTGNAFSNIALYNSILALQQGGNGGGTNGALSVNNSNNLPNAASAGGNSVAAGAGSSSSGANSTAVGNGAQATAQNSVAVGAGSVADRANSVSVGSKGAERQVTNVAAGTADTDAANVSQVNAVRASGVHYDTRADGSVDYGNVSLGSAGTPAVVHNVGAGTAATDAANVGQLNQVADWSRSYTDQKVNAMNRTIQNANNRASAGVASAMAMAGLPQATTPGRNMAAIAGGTFRGESSIAVGVSTVTDGGGWVYKLSGTANSRGDAGFSVGAGMEW